MKLGLLAILMLPTFAFALCMAPMITGNMAYDQQNQQAFQQCIKNEEFQRQQQQQMQQMLQQQQQMLQQQQQMQQQQQQQQQNSYRLNRPGF